MRIKACTPFTTLLRLCVPTIPAVAVDCCVFVLHCCSISHLSPSLSLSLSLPLSPSLSHSGYRYLFDARTAALLVHPADDRATASTFQHDDSSYRLDVGLTGYHYLWRHLSLLLLLVLRPAGDIGGRHRSICPPINAYYVKCRIITLNPT